MEILIVTPASRGTTKGNRITAERWASFIRQTGHRVQIDQAFSGQKADLLIGLHAIKSSASIRRFHAQRPSAPIIVVLTGTDLYRPIQSSIVGLQSLEFADRIVILQPDGLRYLPERFHSKVQVVIQSAEAPDRAVKKSETVFEIIVIGHLRAVKDPFRAAVAARHLPHESTIRVIHLGAALTTQMKQRAEALTASNHRYQWLGAVSHVEATRRLAAGRLMVISSKSEGGAGVVSESLAANVPILASRVSGNIGLLGEHYPGLFVYRATRELADLMYRAETDPRFYRRLQAACEKLRPTVHPEKEAAAVRRLFSAGRRSQ
jgi:putative glycosyltransferase (TIGR04348 family)